MHVYRYLIVKREDYAACTRYGISEVRPLLLELEPALPFVIILNMEAEKYQRSKRARTVHAIYRAEQHAMPRP